MLNTAVVGFIKVSLTDQTLQAKQKNLDLEGVVAFADKLGYRFTADEFRKTVSTLASNELSDDELEQVAGGAVGGAGTGEVSLGSPANQQLLASLYGDIVHRP
ncbi:MAG TPA: Nif11-like leader peptide family RiPP precursor [Aggregatilineales bacterium]|nr:Nif11-like leader peptide family RiPP precursor [Aggregatilineales bacterium]